jgi:hypothetical protein
MICDKPAGIRLTVGWLITHYVSHLRNIQERIISVSPKLPQKKEQQQQQCRIESQSKRRSKERAKRPQNVDFVKKVKRISRVMCLIPPTWLAADVPQIRFIHFALSDQTSLFWDQGAGTIGIVEST